VKIDGEATRAKIIEAEWNDNDNEEYVEERKKQSSERKTHSAINHNDEASAYIWSQHLESLWGTARDGEKHINGWNEVPWKALTKWQPTKLQGKYINCEVLVMNETRTHEKDHVVTAKWPYLTIVGGCGARFVKSECQLQCGTQNFTPISLCTRIYMK
jgi:hypothetical protein